MSKLDKKEFHDEVWSGRGLELTTLWQRSVMLGTFLIGIFAAYFTFLDSFFEAKPDSSHLWKWYLGSCCIALLGYIVSLLWICMGKGSKYWYESYEQALSAMYDDQYNNGLIDDSLIQEDRLSYFRNLYENNLQEFFPRHGSLPEPGSVNSSLFSNKSAQYSVSKINIILGRVMAIVWVGVFLITEVKLGIDWIGMNRCCDSWALFISWLHLNPFLGSLYGVAINWFILIGCIIVSIIIPFVVIIHSVGEHDGGAITTKGERIIAKEEKQAKKIRMNNIAFLFICKVQKLKKTWSNPHKDVCWDKFCKIYDDSPDNERIDIIKDLLASRYKDHVMNYVQRECFCLDKQLNGTWYQLSNKTNFFEIKDRKIKAIHIKYGYRFLVSISQSSKYFLNEPDNIYSVVYRKLKNAHHSRQVDIIWRIPELDGFHYSTIRLSAIPDENEADKKLFLNLSYFYDGEEKYHGMYEKEKFNSSIKNEKTLVQGRNNG